MSTRGGQFSLRLGLAWVAALPWLAALPKAPGPFRRLVRLVYLGLCHHEPTRTLVLSGEPMCVCSRCAGLYLGLTVGFLFGSLGVADNRFSRLFIAAMTMTVLDVGTQDLGLHPPWHVVRLLTGLLLGWSVAAWMVAATSRPRSRVQLY